MSKARFTPALLLAAAMAVAPAAAEENWFVSFEGVQVAPVDRDSTTQLVEVGTIETDGFSELVFSLGGEFKQAVPSSGRVGALLIPDDDIFIFLLKNEGAFVFPLEVVYEVGQLYGAIFISHQQTARVAFPRYRVYLYNETTSGASVSLYVYRTRR